MLQMRSLRLGFPLYPKSFHRHSLSQYNARLAGAGRYSCCKEGIGNWEGERTPGMMQMTRPRLGALLRLNRPLALQKTASDHAQTQTPGYARGM